MILEVVIRAHTKIKAEFCKTNCATRLSVYRFTNGLKVESMGGNGELGAVPWSATIASW